MNLRHSICGAGVPGAARVAGAVALYGALLLPAAGGAAPSDELAEHRAQWQAAAIADYAYGYNKYCACHRDDPPETVVTVRGGKVVRVYHLHDDSDREVPARDGSLDLYWTIDALFDLIDAAENAGAEVRVRYDESLGYPRQLYIDYDKNLVGDEVDLRVTRFTSASP